MFTKANSYRVQLNWMQFVFGFAILSSTAALAQESRRPSASVGSVGAKEKPAVPDLDDPEFAGHFQGRVTGPDGKPLSGARIFIAPNKDTVKDIGSVRAETDALGYFEFDAPDMTYADLDGLPARREGLLVATAEGLALDWMQSWGKNSGRGEPWYPVKGKELQLQLAADGVPIRGRFLDADGKPLTGARVRIERIMVPKDRNLDAHLAREANASISRGFLSGGPDYERSLYRPQMLPVATQTKTDADGRFTFSGLGRDRLVVLSVSAPNVADTSLIVMTRDAPDVRTQFRDAPADLPPTFIYGAGFTFELKRGLSIHGLVRDRDTHEPVSGMWVTRNRNPLNEPSFAADAAVTDEQGRFTISGLNPEMLNYKRSHRGVTAIPRPGIHYVMSKGYIEGNSDVVIDCVRGIPFRLKLRDEDGNRVEANVEYRPVSPNPEIADVTKPFADTNWDVFNRAARQANGTYEGFVLPGPGAVLVETRGQSYRPARVDPRSFFAPDRTDWDAPEWRHAYGTNDTIAIQGGAEQDRYAAIVLVNPPRSSPPLELSATVVKDKPRQVSLVDPDGKPVVGVTMSFDRRRALLRAASFPLNGLHPDRVRHISFIHDERRLIGSLLARGDSGEPYTVRMAPWGAVTGRLVGEDGKPLPIWRPEADYKGPPKLWAEIDGDKNMDHRIYVDADPSGHFRIEKLVPGEPYSARAYQDFNTPSEVAFENQVLRDGEVRNLGDIRTKLRYTPEYREATDEDQRATADIPADAWGEPVDGLRVALKLQSPAVDEFDQLRFEIVAENISDRDIRFGAGDHYEYGYCKTGLINIDGDVPRQPGPRPNWADTLPVIRCWLKPNERMTISPCTAKLLKLAADGVPVPSPKRDNSYHHFFNVKPGRYVVAATIELGTGMTCPNHKAGPHKIEFAAKGEWTGRLQTGAVVVPLFTTAGK